MYIVLISVAAMGLGQTLFAQQASLHWELGAGLIQRQSRDGKIPLAGDHRAMFQWYHLIQMRALWVLFHLYKKKENLSLTGLAGFVAAGVTGKHVWWSYNSSSSQKSVWDIPSLLELHGTVCCWNCWHVRHWCTQLCGNSLKIKLNCCFHMCPTSSQFKISKRALSRSQTVVLHGLHAQEGQEGELSAFLLHEHWPRHALGRGCVFSCPFISEMCSALLCSFVGLKLFFLSFSSHDRKRT